MIHVPLVIHWPGMAPARIAGSVGLVSIAATITDAAGVPPMTGLDGASLVPVLEARRGTTGPVLGVTGGLSFAVHGHFKLVRSRGRADAWMDLLRDPLEYASAPNVGPKDVARLTTALTLATRAPSPRRTPPPVIDADTLRRLRALGYVD
ncbi:MAG: hypothetical protein DRJ42_07290 [Deltaproteobacteria bacterium]|nr:MAG: hypothetical protein DRJ42_07290 [Deltaproteobacteria bacterium]